jgi:hypothetical protein
LPAPGWSALGSGNSGNGSLSAEVWAIAVSGSNVFVGGFFTDIKNNNVPIPEADYIARWDGQNWSALGSNGAGNGSLNQFVTSIAVVGGDLYVGGAFENVNNNGTVLPAADYIAKWNGTEWSAVGSNSGGGTGSLNGSVTALAVDNRNPTQTNLYVGGLFTVVQDLRGTSIAHYIAKWDGQYWSALGSDGAGSGALNAVPRALTFSGGNLYVGGEFTDVNNNGVFLTAADYIAKWDGTNWSALGSNGAGNGSLNNIVYDIAVSGNNVYAGGLFMDVNNHGTILNAGDWVAKWDGSNWSALGSNDAGNGAVQGSVLALAVNDGNLYAGGYFTNVRNNSETIGAADYIAKWDGTNWSAVGSNGAGNGSLNGSVWALTVNQNLYTGGLFTNVNNDGTTLNNADYIAEYRLCVPGPIEVQNTNDSGVGSLRQAIATICSGGTITFNTSLTDQTIMLASSLPSIDKTVTIDGDDLSIKVDGAGHYQIFQVTTNGVLTLNGLTIQNGVSNVPCDDVIPCGGGIYNDGKLTVTNSTFSGNSSQSGGAIFVGRGTADISNSTFLGNSATNAGGGILNWIGSITVINSTFSGNSAYQGGGIYNDVSFLTLKNSTFSGNSATKGSGLYNAGALDFVNNVLANSTSGDDCYNEDGAGVVSMNISNLVEINAAAPNNCDTPALTSDPKLGSLDDNGGPTQTMALLSGSPAINAGNDITCETIDQRGVVRPQGSHCDMGAYEANGSINVSIGASGVGTYYMIPSQSRRESYAGINNGPLKIMDTGNIPITAAERVIYKVNNVPTSFSEMMALPDGQLDNTYWMPWYNNVDLDTQLRFGNVSNAPAEVHVWIGGQEKTSGCTSTPSNVSYPYVLAVGASLRVSCPGVNNGPVQIISNVNIVAAERVIYNVNGLPTSFTEMMALPDSQLNSTYWMPWYNNVDLDTQLRFGNVSNSPAEAHVWIGGQEKTTGCTTTPANVPYPYVLAVGASLRVNCSGVNNGPVKIISNGNIVAAERVIYNVNGLPTSFTEMMALPNSQLNTAYWLPWYNNVDLDTQLRFGNVSETNATATVHLYIGGQEMLNGCSPSSSPYILAAGASLRVSCSGTNNGPVKIVSDIPIVAAERVIYKVNNLPTSFSEMMALPNSQLNTAYWLPWYNNVDLDTQLRFGVP